MQHICGNRIRTTKIANGIPYIPMGYVNRKWYDNNKSFAVIVTSISKSQMGIMWSICDYSVRVYLNRKYTNITNVPKSQMYNILLLHLSINCVPKTVLSVSTRQEELHNIISTKFSMALTVRNELNLSKTF